jgi:hypothetical protein
MKNVCRFFFGDSKVNTHEIYIHREDDIKTDFKEIHCGLDSSKLGRGPVAYSCKHGGFP